MNEKQPGRRRTGGIFVYLLLIILMIGIANVLLNHKGNVKTDYTNADLKKELDAGEVIRVEITQNQEVPTGTVLVVRSKGDLIFYTPVVSETIQVLQNAKEPVKFTVGDVQRPSIWVRLLPYIFGAIMIIVMVFLFAQMSGAGGGAGGGNSVNNRLMNFGRSRAKKDIKTGITFKDVAGLVEEKEELSEIVDFLKDPEKYTKMGARIPKGILLVGPPGTGKTLLAKAISGEADVPFFSISGSDFVEMFVGVGASRVRDLFADAKENAPCLVFIDEIDAVARRRGAGLGGGHDEREQTLNQLLVEMDGFGENEGIIVMAATNRVDILDPAIMRPGRFDRKCAVGRPDVRGREEILQVHTRKKPLGDDVDLHEIARTTSGFSGADLENLMNEAAVHATREGRAFITKSDVDKSFVKVGIGTEKKSRLVPEKERRITAYHEAGHAILFHVLPDMGPVYTVSIIPTGVGAAGYTMPLPENDNVFNTKAKMLQAIQVDFGGRIAEELIFGDVTTGASQDIRQASKTARDMVIRYGFSERVGLINYETAEDDEVFVGRDIGHEAHFSEEVRATIDEEVKKIIDDCYAKAKNILLEHMDILHKAADLLLEKEKITGEEFSALFNVHKTEPENIS